MNQAFLTAAKERENTMLIKNETKRELELRITDLQNELKIQRNRLNRLQGPGFFSKLFSCCCSKTNEEEERDAQPGFKRFNCNND